MSTVDEIEASVRLQLLRGELAPGARLRQDAIADSLGVSKIPVREALQRLTAGGLLRFEANRGAVVPALTAADAMENFALRRSIEPLLLEQALPQITIVDLAKAEVAATAEGGSLTESNWAFHHALYQPSGWRRGLAIVEMLHAAVAPYVLLYTEGLGGAADSDAEHLAMLGACRDGAVDEALELLRRHLDHAEAALTAFLDHS